MKKKPRVALIGHGFNTGLLRALMAIKDKYDVVVINDNGPMEVDIITEHNLLLDDIDISLAQCDVDSTDTPMVLPQGTAYTETPTFIIKPNDPFPGYTIKKDTKNWLPKFSGNKKNKRKHR